MVIQRFWCLVSFTVSRGCLQLSRKEPHSLGLGSSSLKEFYHYFWVSESYLSASGSTWVSFFINHGLRCVVQDDIANTHVSLIFPACVREDCVFSSVCMCAHRCVCVCTRVFALACTHWPIFFPIEWNILACKKLKCLLISPAVWAQCTFPLKSDRKVEGTRSTGQLHACGQGGLTDTWPCRFSGPCQWMLMYELCRLLWEP